MKTEIITDSFDNGSKHVVTKVGRAFIYTNEESRATIQTIAAKCMKVCDYADRRAPAKRAAIREAFELIGFAYETPYNAAHGRRYDLCAYPSKNETARRATLAAQSGMSDTNPEIARPIF